MKYILVICFLLTLTELIQSYEIDPCQQTVFDPQYNWEKYKIEYNKQYNTQWDDDFHHLVFLKNVRAIIKQNCDYSRGLSTWQAGLNQFTSMTEEERYPYSHGLGS